MDYDKYVTPKQGIKHEQSNTARESSVIGGMNEINDEVITYMHQSIHMI